MYTPINRSETGITLDPQVEHILSVTGVKLLADAEGQHFFGFRSADDSWYVVKPVGAINENAKALSWRGGRIDDKGRGFHIDENASFHQALVRTFTLPSPVYTSEDGPAVYDALVKDENEAKALLVEALVPHRSPTMS